MKQLISIVLVVIASGCKPHMNAMGFKTHKVKVALTNGVATVMVVHPKEEADAALKKMLQRAALQTNGYKGQVPR